MRYEIDSPHEDAKIQRGYVTHLSTITQLLGSGARTQNPSIPDIPCVRAGAVGYAFPFMSEQFWFSSMPEILTVPSVGENHLAEWLFWSCAWWCLPRGLGAKRSEVFAGLPFVPATMPPLGVAKTCSQGRPYNGKPANLQMLISPGVQGR